MGDREPLGHPGPPGGRHIEDDIEVEGVLRLGDDCVCDGDIIATGGVILGDRVIVRGDIYTDGPVQMGTGCRIEGEVNPASQAPRSRDPGPTAGTRSPREPSPSTQPSPSSDPGARDRRPSAVASDAPIELKSKALRSTLEIMMALALDAAFQEGAQAPRRWGLREDALEDLLEGAYALMADVHRDGNLERPWSSEEVFNILLRQVVALIVPISVERFEPDRARLKLRRPSSGLRDEAPEGWAGPVVALIELLGCTVDPAFELESLDDAIVQPVTNPDEVILLASTGG